MARLYGRMKKKMALFKNKYRSEPARLQHHDYTFAGPYFITICTKDKKHSFGEILAGGIDLTVAGKIAYDSWQAIPEHFHGISIDAFVVMPNHVHGIIILDNPDGRDAPWRVSTEEHGGRSFGPLQQKSISSIVNAYKSSVTRLCRKEGITGFAWQERFYDHVIRGEKAFHKIRRYINDNIAQWQHDEYNQHA